MNLYLHHKPFFLKLLLYQRRPGPLFSFQAQSQLSFRPGHILPEAFLGSSTYLKDLLISSTHTYFMFSLLYVHFELLLNIWLCNILEFTEHVFTQLHVSLLRTEKGFDSKFFQILFPFYPASVRIIKGTGITLNYIALLVRKLSCIGCTCFLIQ